MPAGFSGWASQGLGAVGGGGGLGGRDCQLPILKPRFPHPSTQLSPTLIISPPPEDSQEIVNSAAKDYFSFPLRKTGDCSIRRVRYVYIYILVLVYRNLYLKSSLKIVRITHVGWLKLLPSHCWSGLTVTELCLTEVIESLLPLGLGASHFKIWDYPFTLFT